MNKTKQPTKFKRFLRNNAALLLLIFCVLAITAVVLSVTLTRNTTVVDGPVVNNPNDDQPGNVTPDDKPNTPSKKKIQVYFAAPVKYSKIGMDFTHGPENLFVFNNTLKMWMAHKALDLTATEGSDVVAMYEGTVIEVGSKYRQGEYVVIDHGDKVVATYASLQNVQVKKGQTVKQGDVIGEASISATAEYMDGAHLHLEVAVNGVKVDPTPYVEGKVYREIEVDA